MIKTTFPGAVFSTLLSLPASALADPVPVHNTGFDASYLFDTLTAAWVTPQAGGNFGTPTAFTINSGFVAG